MFGIDMLNEDRSCLVNFLTFLSINDCLRQFYLARTIMAILRSKAYKISFGCLRGIYTSGLKFYRKYALLLHIYTHESPVYVVPVFYFYFLNFNYLFINFSLGVVGETPKLLCFSKALPRQPSTYDKARSTFSLNSGKFSLNEKITFWFLWF